MTKPRKLAVFDIDGTIFRSSLFIELVEALIETGLMSKSAREIFQREKKSWQDRRGSYEEYLVAMVRAFHRYLPGIPYQKFMEVSESVIAKEKYKTYLFTRDLVKKLKRQGYFLLAISNSPKGILDKFCKTLGFDKVYGRIYEINASDELTGQVLDLHLISNKGAIVKRAVERENLTLKDSVAVGDTESDIAMLELVTRPICFNPNKKLYRYAKINQWEVIVERKDVVYEIN